MLNFFKKPSVMITSILLVLMVASMVYFNAKNKAPKYEFVTAKKGDLTQEVSVTGHIKAIQTRDLAFEISGKISDVYVRIGDRVSTGRTLARLGTDDLVAQLQQARSQVTVAQNQSAQQQAALQREQARLADLSQGSPANINIAETQLNNADLSLSNAQTNLTIITNKADADLQAIYDDVFDSMNDAFAKADDAVRRLTADIFTTTLGRLNAQLSFGINDPALKSNVESQKNSADNDLLTWRNSIAQLNRNSPAAQLDGALDNAVQFLSHIRDLLNLEMDAVDQATTLLASAVAAYKTNIGTARTNISAALNGVTNLKQSISAQRRTNQIAVNGAQSMANDARNAVNAAESQLNAQVAGATDAQITAQQAQVRFQFAAVNAADAQIQAAVANVAYMDSLMLKKTMISPINGIVTKQDAKAGQTVNPNIPVMSVISEGQFDVEAPVTEIDVSKIKTGQKADVTLDAYGSDVIFSATVAFIDPAETMAEGVATYKITLTFEKQDPRMKSGMTANVDIMAGERKDAIYIPGRTIYEKNGEKFVQILKDNSPQEVKVQAGFRASDGNVEIESGLNEGDKIILQGL